MHSWVERSFALLRTLAVVSFAFSWSCESSSSKSADAGADASDVDSATEEHDRDAGEGDAGSGDAGAGDAGAGDAGIDGGESRRDVYAVKTVIDVWWQDDVNPPMIDSGRGLITLFHKVNLAQACDDGEIRQVELEPCGIELPPLVSWVGCLAHQLAVPASFWSSSATRAWSPAGVLEHDGDASVPIELGKLGTTHRATGCGIGTSPVLFQGFPPFSTATAICDFTAGCPVAVELVARTQVSLGSWLDGCSTDEASGMAELAASSVGLSIEACVLSDGTACSAEEREYVDAQMPAYRILDQGSAPPLDALASPCDCPGGCGGDACLLDQTSSLGTRSAIVWLEDESADLDCEAIRSAVDTAYPGSSF